MAGNDRPRRGNGEQDVLSRIPLPSEGSSQELIPSDIRDPSFPSAVGGYARRSVDTYVERVNRLVAELQVSGSPRAAVRHALDRVGEQTSGILQRARETAEEITTSAREEAEETTARARAEADDIRRAAEREADETAARARAEAGEIVAAAKAQAEEILVKAKDEAETTTSRARVDAEGKVRRAEEEIAALREQAEARMHALQADVAAVSEERARLLEDARGLLDKLQDVLAGAEEEEQPPPPVEGAEQEHPAPADA